MKKTLKTLVAMFLALAIAFTCVPQTAEAGAKITTAKVGKTKTVQMKLYKGAGKHTAKVKVTDMSYRGTSEGYNVYHVGITVKNTKLTQAEANGISRECRQKFLSGWNSTDLVLTDSQGNDIRGTKAVVPREYLNIKKSSGKFKKKANYIKGFMRYKDTVSYYKTVNYDFFVVVPAYETDVYVGIAGLKNGQPSSSKMSQYNNGLISFKSAGFGGKKQNIVAVKVQ